MNRYTIYCTPEQTREAFELGAPIECTGHFISFKQEGIVLIKNANYRIPNVAQMIYWLRTKGFRFKICEYERTTSWIIINNNWINHGGCGDSKEAILAAIDAALEYLYRNK